MQDGPEYSSLVSHLYQEPLEQWMVEDLKLQILHLMSSILKAENKIIRKKNMNSTCYNYLIVPEDQVFRSTPSIMSAFRNLLTNVCFSFSSKTS